MKSLTNTLSLLFVLFILTANFSTVLAQDSLVAFYPFSGSAEDSSGFDHHGTVYGATLTEDRFGNPNSAYSFDGINNYIHTNTSFDYQYRTVSVWIKTNFADSTGDNYQSILNQDSNELTYGAFSFALDDGAIRFREGASEGKWYFHVENNKWYHLLMVRMDSVVKGFVNGKLVGIGTAESTGSSSNPSNELLIGTTRMYDRFFNGSIDDIRIYNYALDSLAMNELYTQGGWPLPQDSTEIPSDTLIAHFPFNGTAEDESGFENHGIVNGASLTFDRFGNPNSAYNFDGIDDYINIGNNKVLDFIGDFTISIWAKGVGSETSLAGLVAKHTMRPFGMGIDDGDRLFFSVTSEGIHYDIHLNDFNTDPDKWHHYVGVFKKSEFLKLYKDGHEIGAITENVPAFIDSSDYPLLIGQRSHSIYPEQSYNVMGDLDDIYIYNYALDSLSIHNLYSAGGWPLPEDSTIVPHDTLAAYYPFNGNAEDESGFKNNGIVHGAKLTFDRFGNPNSAFNFDGIDDYIELPQDFDFPERSISFWFNAKNIPEWDRENDPNHSLRSIYISDHPQIENGLSSVWVTKINGNNKVCFHNGGADVHLDNCFSIDEMQWYFATMTVTPSTIKYFLNGELLKTRDFPGNIYSVTHNGFYKAALGVGRNVDHRFFKGNIDDVRIYNYAINDWKVQELYTTGGWPLPEDSTIVPNDTLAAYYPFNGNAEDSSGYGNHGQVFGATLTEDRFGNPESAYTFDGIDDHIVIENPAALHTAKNLSVSFWAKGISNDTSFAGLITSPNMQPFGLAMDDKGRILFSISSESIPLNLVASDMNIYPDDWHQYVAVYQANEYLKLFKDGNLSAALYGTIPGFMDTGSSGVYIGALPISYPGIEEISFFSGSIDDIRFYNHALTNEDVNILYESERTIPVKTEVDLEFPSKFQLYQNYPNPFNPTTNISFDLPSTEVISLKVYDMTGRLIITLIDGRIPAGSHQITFDASQLASGVYLYELKGAGYSNIKKLTLIK